MEAKGDDITKKENQTNASGNAINTSPKKKQPFWRRKKVQAEVIYKYKTVADVPPVLALKRAFDNGEVVKGISTCLSYMTNDLKRFYGIKFINNLTPSENIYLYLKSIDKNFPEDFIVKSDESLIDIDRLLLNGKSGDEFKFGAIKKYITFYKEGFQKIMYRKESELNKDDIENIVKDFYSYMDIKKLYFSEVGE
ncbi:hypothetical protein [Caldiplasma sukawensis]